MDGTEKNTMRCCIKLNLSLLQLSLPDMSTSVHSNQPWPGSFVNTVATREGNNKSYYFLRSYENDSELKKRITSFVLRYNTFRPHDSLGESTPEGVYCNGQELIATG